MSNHSFLRMAGWLGGQGFKFNRSMFRDVSQPCSRTGLTHVTLNKTNPTAFLKLDIRSHCSRYYLQYLQYLHSGSRPWSPTRPSTASSRCRPSSATSPRSSTTTTRTSPSWCSTSNTDTWGGSRYLSALRQHSHYYLSRCVNTIFCVLNLMYYIMRLPPSSPAFLSTSIARVAGCGSS